MVINEKMSTKQIMKHESKCGCLESLKHRIELKLSKINDGSTNCNLKIFLRWYFSDTASYNNRVSWDSLFNTLDHELPISKIARVPTADRNMRKKQVNEEMQKRMVYWAGIQQIEMSWWRRC